MFLVSLQNPTIEVPTLELFAQRTDGWRQERFDFGLGLPRPAQRPKQSACRQVSSGKAVPDQKLPSFERLVEPLKRQQEALCRPTRGLGADVHHLRHRAPNRCKREREQRTLQPGRILAQKSQGRHGRIRWRTISRNPMSAPQRWVRLCGLSAVPSAKVVR